MGRYDKHHVYVDDPFTWIKDTVAGTSTKKTVLVDKETGRRVEAIGLSFAETDRKAWERMNKK